LSRPSGTEKTPRGQNVDEGTAAPQESDSWYRAYVTSNEHLGTPEENAAYFARIFEEAPAPYIVTDPSMLIRDANRAAQRILKRPLLWLRGKPLYSVVAKGERRAFNAIAPDIVATHTVMTRPLRLQPAQGEEIDVFFSACAARDRSGKPETIFWIFLHPLEPWNEDLL